MGQAARRPKYFCVNCDEMEPGTFKDRILLEGDPHQLLEGTIISSFALGADIAYIFLRWEYRLAARRIRAAIAEARAAGLVGRNILGSGYDLELHLHTSAGRYMCGEEEGLINALQGERATPRAKPPHPQTSGLWGKPTVVNNAETVCNIPHIVRNGPDWFRKLSRNPDDGGTKLYGVSGRVNYPGLWELPMGATAREVLDYAGGMAEGFRLRGLLPGGASTDFITPEHLDVPMDFESLQGVGSRLGTGTMIVLDDKTCPVGMVHNLLAFFARESCGWCTPCREGLPWAAKCLRSLEDGQGTDDDIAVLERHTRMLLPGNTFCYLAPGAMSPLQSALRLFGDDFRRHVELKRCPYR
jgi:NADH-quinone oxidoreductase subunit F